jgi:hypothetical protein
MRDVWIANVAQSYARLDPQSAITWLRRYQSEPAYAAGVAGVVSRVVAYDPALAADLLTTVVDSGGNVLQRPAHSVAETWARQNQLAARPWVTSLPEGPVRDSALWGFISVAFPSSIPESSLLALFSSEKAKQQAIATQIYRIGEEDPAEARRLLDRHITLPELHSQISSWLDRPPDQRSPVFSPGGFIVRD